MWRTAESIQEKINTECLVCRTKYRLTQETSDYKASECQCTFHQDMIKECIELTYELWRAREYEKHTEATELFRKLRSMPEDIQWLGSKGALMIVSRQGVRDDDPRRCVVGTKQEQSQTDKSE